MITLLGPAAAAAPGFNFALNWTFAYDFLFILILNLSIILFY